MNEEQRYRADATTKIKCLLSFPEVSPEHTYCLAINCLSFTMGMLLPERHVTYKQNKQEMIQSLRADFTKRYTNTTGLDVLFYGLDFEELNYPKLIRNPDSQDTSKQTALRPSGHKGMWVNDRYSLVWSKEWEVVLEEDNSDDVKLHLVVERDGLCEVESLKLRLSGTQDYLSCHFHEPLLRTMQKEENTEITQKDAILNSVERKSIDPEHIIFGYKCKIWPVDFTATWLRRSKATNWPGQNVIERIISRGCHVVPCTHEQKESKWKFAFAEAEQVLTSILTKPQRQCFMLIEILMDRLFQPQTVFTPLQLKHLFFWLCEKLHPEKWLKENGLAVACLTLLNDLQHALDIEKIPNYFIPEVNILQNLNKTSLRGLREDIVKFRKAPFENLMNLFDRYKFEFLPSAVPVGHLFRDMWKLFQECQREPVKVRCSFMSTALHFAIVYFLEDRINEGLDQFNEANKVCKTFLDFSMSLPVIIHGSAAELSPESAVRLYEMYVNHTADDDEIYITTVHLACMYHACVHEHQQGTPQHLLYITKAEETFQTALAMPPADSAVKCSYALFLNKLNKTDKAIEILKDVIKTDSRMSTENCFGKSEIKTVDGFLANEINANGELSCPSLVLALYCLFHIYGKISEPNETKNQVLNKFENICSDIDKSTSHDDTNPVIFSMLGYCYRTNEDHEKAKMWFLKALEIKPDYELAQDNIEWCEGMSRLSECQTQ